jgi:SPP1 gp7 family putative phage head morphogenesis protein
MSIEEQNEYYRLYHTFQMGRELNYTPKFYKELVKQQNFFIEQIKKGVDYNTALNAIPFSDMYELEKKLYNECATVWGAKVRLSILRQETTQKKARSPIGFNAEMVRLMNQYFLTDWANIVAGITDTTKAEIQKVLIDANGLGWSINEIVEAIQNEELTRMRARRIARTETNTAANQAGRFAAKATGRKLNKIWIATRDNRTRHDHSAVNGQIVGIDETFNVGGYPMLQPGDRGTDEKKTPAKEIVNCRCTSGYIPIK